jgi:hypothetical protein
MTTKAKTRGPAPYRGPYGTPLAQVHYREGRHLEPERIPFRRHETPTTLRLLDVSKESLENVKKIAATVKRLLAHSLKVRTFVFCFHFISGKYLDMCSSACIVVKVIIALFVQAARIYQNGFSTIDLTPL